jgi:8-oxo-dGTP diphosphatase
MTERPCVGALLVRRRGGSPPRILLGKRAADRAFYPDVWDVLGGHLEPNETPEQALVRELREEVGVTPTAWRALEEYRGPLPGRDELLVLSVFAVTAWTGTPRNRSPGEHASIAWFEIEDARRLALAHPAYPAMFRRCASATA